MKNKKAVYSKRSDLEKVKSNWRKTKGLFTRGEWSTVVIRAVTTVELSANYVIRKELQEKRKLEKEFVDHLLIWANGIRGKFDKLLIPLFRKTDFEKDLKKLKKKVEDINKVRNIIVHSGQFKKEVTALRVMEESKEIIETLISEYERDFKLK